MNYWNSLEIARMAERDPVLGGRVLAFLVGREPELVAEAVLELTRKSERPRIPAPLDLELAELPPAEPQGGPWRLEPLPGCPVCQDALDDALTPIQQRAHTVEDLDRYHGIAR